MPLIHLLPILLLLCLSLLPSLLSPSPSSSLGCTAAATATATISVDTHLQFDSQLQPLDNMAASNGSKALRYAVLIGSTRDGRLGIKAAEYAIKQLQNRGHHVDVLDAKEEQLPMLFAPFHHYGTYRKEEAPEQLKKLAAKLTAADGFLVVDPEYNHSPSPGMLNLLDHFYHPQYKFKSAAIFTYSMQPAGGARAGYVLRNTLGELGMITAPSIFSLGQVHVAFGEDGDLKEESLAIRFQNFLNEFDWYTQATKTQRSAGLPEVAKSLPPSATQPSATNK